MSTETAAIEEDVLNAEPSDHALEQAVRPIEAQAMSFSFCTSVYVCPWWRGAA